MYVNSSESIHVTLIIPLLSSDQGLYSLVIETPLITIRVSIGFTNTHPVPPQFLQLDC